MRPRRNMVKGIQNNPAFLQKGQTSPLLRQKLPSAYGSICQKGRLPPGRGCFECVAADDIAARKQLLAAYIVSHGQIPSCLFRRTHQPFTTFPLVFAIHYNRIRFIKQSEFYQVFTFFSAYAALSKLLQQQTEASHRAVREKPLQRRTEKNRIIWMGFLPPNTVLSAWKSSFSHIVTIKITARTDSGIRSNTPPSSKTAANIKKLEKKWGNARGLFLLLLRRPHRHSAEERQEHIPHTQRNRFDG